MRKIALSIIAVSAISAIIVSCNKDNPAQPAPVTVYVVITPSPTITPTPTITWTPCSAPATFGHTSPCASNMGAMSDGDYAGKVFSFAGGSITKIFISFSSGASPFYGRVGIYPTGSNIPVAMTDTTPFWPGSNTCDIFAPNLTTGNYTLAFVLDDGASSSPEVASDVIGGAISYRGDANTSEPLIPKPTLTPFINTMMCISAEYCP